MRLLLALFFCSSILLRPAAANDAIPPIPVYQLVGVDDAQKTAPIRFLWAVALTQHGGFLATCFAFENTSPIDVSEIALAFEARNKDGAVLKSFTHLRRGRFSQNVPILGYKRTNEPGSPDKIRNCWVLHKADNAFIGTANISVKITRVRFADDSEWVFRHERLPEVGIPTPQP